MLIEFDSSYIERYIHRVSYRYIDCDNGITQAVICVIEDDEGKYHYGISQKQFDDQQVSLLEVHAKKDCVIKWMEKLMHPEIRKRYIV